MILRRLIWQLVPAFLLVTLVALVPTALYSARMFRDFYMGQAEGELRLFTDATIDRVQELLDGPIAEVDALCKRLGKADDGRIRVTVILPGGEVIGDSDKALTEIKNHADRPEIIAAMQTGEGTATRISPTLGINMLYVAKSIKPGDEVRVVVRTAVAIQDIEQALAHMMHKIVWGGAIVVLCAAGLSFVIARRISRPIIGMEQVASEFAEGNLSRRVPVPNTIELRSLARALNKMARQLDERIKTITEQHNEAGAILSSMIEGVVAVDAEGHVVRMNQAAADFLDVDAEWASGHTFEEVVRNVGLQTFTRKILAGEDPKEAEVALPHMGGRFFHVQGAPLAGEEEKLSGAVIVLHDMTRIHRLETVRRDFVANVSHELKTPITSIKGFVEALLEGDLTDIEQSKYYLGIVEKHADRLNAIIDDLLTLSRLEENDEQMRLSLVEIPILSVLESAVELSCIKAGEKNIRLQLDCSDALTAQVSAPLLEQAIVNLVDNAIKYSEAGSTVFLSASADAQGVHIAVQDTGCGIPKEHIPRLFERFYVVDKGRSRKLGGTGLGLAIVKHIAHVHGGSVRVKSAIDQGTTFTIELPVAATASVV